MIISIGGAGRLGNNILLAADLASFALEHDLQLEILGLSSLARYLRCNALAKIRVHGQSHGLPRAYRFLRNSHVANSLRRATALGDWPLPLVTVVGDRHGGCPTPGKLVRLARKKCVVYAGWNFRAQPLLVRHQSQVRTLLKLQPRVTERVSELMRGLRDEQGAILGLHIRRGDYRTWCDGRFYYDDHTYQQSAINVLEACRKEFLNPRILLVSDEPTEWPSELSGVPVIRFMGSVVEDLAALSLCDRILGPPSTFAMSASLIGNVPYLQVTDPRAPICVDRFFTYGSEVFPEHARIEHLLRPGQSSADAQQD